MWKILTTLIALFISVIGVFTCLIQLIRLLVLAIQKKNCASVIHLIRNNVIFLGIVFIFIAVFIFITQITAYTPKILGADGKPLEGSIAELRKIELNGRTEWITLRGNDKTAPILLFLAGGPGGSQLAATRADLGELEKHFVIVNWDQPGSCKSYLGTDKKNLTLQTYIDDGISLTETLLKEFHQEKVYIVGESWGSALGIYLIKEKPEYYAGFIGCGQMVDFAETDKINYETAMEIANKNHDQKLIDSLLKEGEPPYTSGNICMRSTTYFNCLNTYMAKHPAKQSNPFHTLQDLCGSEYGVLDSINYFYGLVNIYNVIWPQLEDEDLRETCNSLSVPIYFFTGRFDVNAPTSLVEDYYDILTAPEKEIVWFEHSGHTPWTYETPKFCDELMKRFHE